MRRPLLVALFLLSLSGSAGASARADETPTPRLAGVAADKPVLVIGPPEERDPCAIASPVAGAVAAFLRGADGGAQFPGAFRVGYEPADRCDEPLAKVAAGGGGSTYSRGRSPAVEHARRLAWLIAQYNAGTRKPVDVVALGGASAIVAQMLELVRYTRTHARTDPSIASEWPADPQIEDLVFVAPPFDGSTALARRCGRNSGGPICAELGRPVGVSDLLGDRDANIDVTVILGEHDDVVPPESSSRFRVDHLLTYRTRRTETGPVELGHDDLLRNVSGTAVMRFDHIGRQPGIQQVAPNVAERVAKAVLISDEGAYDGDGDDDPAAAGFASCIDPVEGLDRRPLSIRGSATTASGVELAVYGLPTHPDEPRRAQHVLHYLIESRPPAHWPDRLPGAFPAGTPVVDAMLQLFTTTEGRAELRLPIDDVPGSGPRPTLRIYLANLPASKFAVTGPLCDPATGEPNQDAHVAVAVNRRWTGDIPKMRVAMPHEVVHVLYHGEAPAVGTEWPSRPLQESLAAYVSQLFAPEPADSLEDYDRALAAEPGFRPAPNATEYGGWRFLARLRDHLGPALLTDENRQQRFMAVMKVALRTSPQAGGSAALRAAYNASAQAGGCRLSSGCLRAFDAVYQAHWADALANTLRGATVGPRLWVAPRDRRSVDVGRAEPVRFAAVDGFAVSHPLLFEPGAGVRSIAYRLKFLDGCEAHCIVVSRAPRALGLALANSAPQPATAELEYVGCASGRRRCLEQLCPEAEPDDGLDLGAGVCGVWEFRRDDDRRQIEYVVKSREVV